MTEHICSCNVCSASRALNAVLELDWPEENRVALELLDKCFNAFIDRAASDEMDYAYNMGRIGYAIGLTNDPTALLFSGSVDAILAKIGELTKPGLAAIGE